MLDRIFTDSGSVQLFFGSPVLMSPFFPAAPLFRPTQIDFRLEGRGGSASSGFGVHLSLEAVVVPEPGIAVLILFGLSMLSVRRRRAGQRG